jgi:uncharacterized protein YjeT (DUF2065 family)
MWPRAALLVEQRRRFRNIEQALIGGSHESDPEHVSFDLAIVALIFGLGFVLVPGLMFSIYGITSAPASFLGFRLFGSALIAIGVLTWFLKDSEQQTCGQSGAIVERRDSRAAEVSDKTGNALCW